MSEFTYNVVRHVGVLSTYRQDDVRFSKELNVVSWNKKPAKFDIRDWSEDHKSMSKGVTLTVDEALTLYKLLGEVFSEKKEA